MEAEPDKLQECSSAIFGVAGRGGLARDVEYLETKVEAFREEIRKITDSQTKHVGVIDGSERKIEVLELKVEAFREEIRKINDIQTKQVGVLVLIGFIGAPFLEAFFMKLLHAG